MDDSGYNIDQSNVKIEVEEDQEEVSNVRSCYIWFSENAQSNLLEENTIGKRVSRKRRKCAIFGCNNYTYTKKINSEERMLPFHKFPSDETTRAIWIELCGRTDKFSAKCSFICSIHFKPEDYLRYSRLRTGAIPSRNLPMFKVKPVGEVTSEMSKILYQDDKLNSVRNSTHEEEVQSFSYEVLGKELGKHSTLNGLNKEVKKELCSEEGSGEVNDDDHSTTIAITSSDENENRVDDSLEPLNSVRKDRRSVLTQNLNKALRKRDQLVAANLAKLDEGPKNYPNISMWLKSLVDVKDVEEPEIKKPVVTYMRKLVKKKIQLTDQSAKEESICQPLNNSCAPITIVSSDEDDFDDCKKDNIQDQQPFQKNELNALRDKIRILENHFEELRIETKQEIERLKGIMRDKEEEFNVELREVLSVFLNPEQVESVVSQTKR